MPACAVYGCRSYASKTKGSDIRYYRFPKNDNLLKQWLHACHRQDKINVQSARICSKHFQPSCFISTMRQKLFNYQPRTFRNLITDAIPTEHLPRSEISELKHGVQQEIEDRKSESFNEVQTIWPKETDEGGVENSKSNNNTLWRIVVISDTDSDSEPTGSEL